MLAGLAMSTVYPSGAECTTLSAAIDEPAPARFSMITGCPRKRPICSLYARATVSAAPPGANPTTSRIGLFGNPCAAATLANANAATAIAIRFTPLVRPS